MARVYLHGSPGKRPDQIAKHTVTACPAGHLHGIELPTEFFDFTGRDPKPREFVVAFHYGRSDEITDALAKYMVEFGIASREEWRPSAGWRE